jgi:hypothetical protein
VVFSAFTAMLSKYANIFATNNEKKNSGKTGISFTDNIFSFDLLNNENIKKGITLHIKLDAFEIKTEKSFVIKEAADESTSDKIKSTIATNKFLNIKGSFQLKPCFYYTMFIGIIQENFDLAFLKHLFFHIFLI